MKGSEIKDLNAKNYIWNGERVSYNTYMNMRDIEIREEIANALNSVADYDASDFDQDLYRDQQFVPSILEVLVSEDDYTQSVKTKGIIMQMREQAKIWFFNKPWLNDLVKSLDKKLDDIDEQHEYFKKQLREANKDIV